MEKKDKIISFLSVLLLLCTILFATMYNTLEASNNHISRGNWSLNISSVSIGKKVGDVSSIDVDASSTTAVVNFTMADVGDAITYNIRVANGGTIDATLDNIIVVGNSDNVTYDIGGTIIGSKLNAGGVDNIIIKFKNNNTEEKHFQENIAIILNYK